MSYSGYPYTAGAGTYDQAPTEVASYSESTYDAGSVGQYRAPEAGVMNQYTTSSSTNPASYDYSYSTDYYSQSQASQQPDYSQHSQMSSYGASSAPAAVDSYYSYSTDTSSAKSAAQPSHYTAGEDLGQSYPSQQQTSTDYGRQPQYQHATTYAQPAYSAPSSHSYENSTNASEPYGHTSAISSAGGGGGGYSYHTTQASAWSTESQYSDSRGNYYTDGSSSAPAVSYSQQEGSGYGGSRRVGGDSFSSYAENTYLGSSASHISHEGAGSTASMGHPYPYQSSSQPFQSNNQSFQQSNQPFQSSSRPFQSNNQSFEPRNRPFQSNNRPFQANNQSFEPSNKPFKTSNPPFQPNDQSFEPSNQPFQSSNRPFQSSNQSFESSNQPFQSKNRSYGGYSGPAPSSRGSWKAVGESSRGGFSGGPSTRGRSSGQQDFRGSFGGAVGGSWGRGGQQFRGDNKAPPSGGNWRGGNHQPRRSGDFQATSAYGARKKPEGYTGGQSHMNEGQTNYTRTTGAGLGSARGRLQTPAYTPAQIARPDRSDAPAYQTPVPRAKPDAFKVPSRPQDKLLNEVEEKVPKPVVKKKLTPEELKREEEKRKKEEEERKKAEEERKKAEEERKKVEEEEALKRAEEEKKRVEEEQKKAAEELREKLAEEAVKAAPPSKPPETPEEIAYEEEIQRKIRESVVVLTSAAEEAPPTPAGDPTEELEISDELRELLTSLTTQYLCKLCSVRIVGSQMAGMHYNGKNHLKKLRNFVQTNGRSAGFYLGVAEEKAKEAKDDDKVKDAENKAEAVEITEVDEKKYCKICKVSFSQPSQAEMHYKGKNHAKKLKTIGGANGPEVFECKICCVTVTAQEHLTAHLNGARHKLQVRKIDANENYSGSVPNRGRGGLGYRGRGGRGGGSDWKPAADGGTRGGRGGFRGRGYGDFRGRGHDQEKRSLIDYTDEELLSLFAIEPSKKFCFDLANYRTPSGSYYCSSCDVSMAEEPQFLLHLGSRKHQEKVLGKRRRVRRNASSTPLKESVTLNNSIRRD